MSKTKATLPNGRQQKHSKAKATLPNVRDLAYLGICRHRRQIKPGRFNLDGRSRRQIRFKFFFGPDFSLPFQRTSYVSCRCCAASSSSSSTRELLLSVVVSAIRSRASLPRCRRCSCAEKISFFLSTQTY